MKEFELKFDSHHPFEDNIEGYFNDQVFESNEA